MGNKLISVLIGFVLSVPAIAKTHHTKGVRTIRLSDKVVATIRVNKNGTVINFPTKPKKVILGRKQSFDIDYIENDVAVAALSANASSNLYVYLQGRRYAFYLYVVPKGGDEIILVRDAMDSRMRVKVQ